jgi:hypothetical protein
MILYSANPNAQPTDKRGRPRMAPDINRSILIRPGASYAVGAKEKPAEARGVLSE